MEKVRAHVVVSGRVQGVCFRSYAEEEAYRNNVFGWIRNTAGGEVEAVYEGEKVDVGKMIEWSKRGSPSSRVDKVDVKWEPYTGEFEDFGIKYWR